MPSKRRIRSVFRRAGTKVCIQPTPAYRRAKGIVHLTRKCGTLMEDARIGPEAGWDVYDVRLPSGQETSAYGFDLMPRASKRKRK